MIRALHIAASGMAAQQTNIDAISHNIANVNTTGFKKGRSEFQDLLYAHIQTPFSGNKAILAVGHGAQTSHLQRIFTNGNLQLTGNTYDLAIVGQGFFRIRQENGTEAYTRDGQFRLDNQGRLVTHTGNLVMGENGPISIPADAENPEVTSTGIVRYTDRSALTDPTRAANSAIVVDRLSLARIPDPGGMIALGESLWEASEASGEPQLVGPGEEGLGIVSQGALENSNVQIVEEMTNLMMAQRVYSMNSKVAQTADEMMGLANQIRRG
jgi:flagellar basal-body rod protein FlgG